MRFLIRPNLRAFGLIEVCLSLIILGFIVTMSMNMTTITAKQRHLHRQANKLKHIRKALNLYYRANKTYPLPSGSDGISPDVPRTPSSRGYSTGYVPVKTLGLIDISQESHLGYAVIDAITYPPRVSNEDVDNDGAGLAIDEPAPTEVPTFHVKDSRGSPLIDERRQAIVLIIAPKSIIDRMRTAHLTLTRTEQRKTLIITQPRIIS